MKQQWIAWSKPSKSRIMDVSGGCCSVESIGMLKGLKGTLRWLLPMLERIRKWWLDCLRLGAFPHITQGKNHKSPILCQALRDRNFDLAVALIEIGIIDLNEAETFTFFSPFYLAYRLNHFELLNKLLGKGAELNLKTDLENNIFPLASWAVQNNNL